jgi:hypothetical protein
MSVKLRKRKIQMSYPLLIHLCDEFFQNVHADRTSKRKIEGRLLQSIASPKYMGTPQGKKLLNYNF